MASVSTAFQSGGWGFELALRARSARGGQVEARLRGLRMEALPLLFPKPATGPEPRPHGVLFGVSKTEFPLVEARQEAREPGAFLVPAFSDPAIYARRGGEGPLRFLREAPRIGIVVDTYA